MTPSAPSCLFLTAVLTAAAGNAADRTLGEQALRDHFVGNTATFRDSDLSRVEAYFAPGGELRGLHGQREFAGSWSIEDGRLCVDLRGTFSDACSTVVRRTDQKLQFFTSAGEPAGYVSIESGNPEGF